MCGIDRPETETKFDALYITAGLSVKEILKEIEEDRLSVDEVPEFFKEDVVRELDEGDLHTDDIPLELRKKFDI